MIALSLSLAQNWVQDSLLTSPQLAGLGAVALIVLVLTVIAAAVRACVKPIARLRTSLADRALRRSNTVDQRLLLTRPTGLRGRAAMGFVSEALEKNLPDFIFGVPVQLVKAGPVGPDAFAARVERADAEGILHIDCKRSAKPQRLILSGAARRTSARVAQFEFDLPGVPAHWSDELGRAIAYLVAKAVQPALARPQDFRAERVQGLAQSLWQLLQADLRLPLELHTMLVDDFCACGLHLAEHEGDHSWLGSIIDLRRAQIDAPSDGMSSEDLIYARVDLGCALIISVQRQYDPALLQDGVRQLGLAIEDLRKTSILQITERADIAVGRAHDLANARKRFSITPGG